MIYFAYRRQPIAFLVFYIIDWLIDTTDGTVARKLNSVTELGNLLDTITDYLFIGSYLVSFYFFFPVLILDYLFVILLIFFVSIANKIISYQKFKKVLMLHTWAGKTLHQLMALFAILSIITETPVLLIFRIALVTGIIHVVEEFLIIRKLKHFNEDIHSIFELKK